MLQLWSKMMLEDLLDGKEYIFLFMANPREGDQLLEFSLWISVGKSF